MPGQLSVEINTLTEAAGFPDNHIAFVTAYMDRSRTEFKKTVDTLAWDSYAWFASEPNNVLHLDGTNRILWPHV